jgi:hypothetical protein
LTLCSHATTRSFSKLLDQCADRERTCGISPDFFGAIARIIHHGDTETPRHGDLPHNNRVLTIGQRSAVSDQPAAGAFQYLSQADC